MGSDSQFARFLAESSPGVLSSKFIWGAQFVLFGFPFAHLAWVQSVVLRLLYGDPILAVRLY